MAKLKKTDTPLAPQELALDALGNPVRRQLLAMLTAKPQSVAELATAFPISRPAISRHLILLEQAGFISHLAQGTKNIYRIETKGFALTNDWLQSFWNEAEHRIRLLAENISEDTGE